MKGTLTIITPSGILVMEPLKGVPDPDRVSAALNGGTLECIPYFSRFDGQDCLAFCDEDGKGKQLPLNAGATALWAAQVGEPLNDYLAGPVVIISGDRELLRGL